MANPTIFDLRSALADANAALVAPQRRLDEILAQDNPALPPPLRARLRALAAPLITQISQLTVARDAAKAEYDTQVAADPMHDADTTLPVALLPVRLETAYLPGAAGTDLVVRVYPDDIHVDAHETELTDAELAAGTTYWKAVWGAGANQARLDAAWNILRRQLKPSRAAWAAQALTPAVPRAATETPVDQAQPEPTLSEVATRPGSFTRPARTSLLPDRWHFIGVRDGAVVFAVDGPPIPDGLDVSFGPAGTAATSSDLPFDEGSRWLVDLDAAIAKGMAIRIPMTAGDLTLDQLFVLGVNPGITPDTFAERLQSLLTAHEFTNGLAFLPPGTPTNNTPGSRSAWQSAPEPPTPSEVATARASYDAASKQNAAVAALGLGIDGSTTLSAAPHGLKDQLTEVFLLQRQLWPALGGNALWLLNQLWDPATKKWSDHRDPALVQSIMDHAVGWVRSRGTLPTLRVGNQPYGLLPVSSLSDWATAAGDPTTPLVGWLRLLRPYWLAGVVAAPRVVVGDAGRDPDKDVVDVLSRLPRSSALVARPSGQPWAAAEKPLPLAAIPDLPVFSMLYMSAPDASPQPVPLTTIADPVADHQFVMAFVEFLTDCLSVIEQTITWEALVAKYPGLTHDGQPFEAPPPDLFNSLLKDSFGDQQTVPDNATLVILVFGAVFFVQLRDQPDQLQRLRDALPQMRIIVSKYQGLTAIDAKSYEPLVWEILDVFSHRFDAWVTSLAARRLEQLRTARPTGVVVGGYGWIEDLAPRSDLTPVPAPPPGFDSVFSSERQHFIHAPSLQHAATAAVLRAGYDSHNDSEALGVNLVSRRVRIADWLTTGVRNGQTLGALLGYRFERGLHDHELDALIENFRAKFPTPLPDNADGGVNDTQAREAIEARNVVDGLALYNKRDDVKAEFAGTPKVVALVDDLADAVDAVGDLLLAESVHHLVGGNPLRAGLAADTIGRGETLPDRFEVVRTPRSGRPLTWYVGALLPAAWRGDADGWNRSRPRAALAPHVEAWAESVFGDANQWTLSFAVTPAGGAASTLTRGLDTFNLSALDVVVESTGSPSQLERRLADLVAAGQPDGAAVVVSRAPAPEGKLGIAELVGLATRIRAILGTASPLGPQHVEGPDASAVLGIDAAELDSRATAFQASFQAAVATLTAATQALDAAAGADPATIAAAVKTVRDALVGLADHGIALAYPSPAGADADVDASAIAAQAASVVAIVGPISEEKLPDLPGPNSTSSFVSQWLDALTIHVQEIAGKSIPVLSTFTRPATSIYAQSLAPAAAPAGADGPAMLVWLRRLANVRSRVAALHDALLATESFGALPALTAMQLPVQAGARWIGLPFEAGVAPKTRVSLVLTTPAAINPADAFCGLMIDTWSEPLPGITAVANPAKGHEAAEITGMSFTVDAPDASAPQAVLLAVAPDLAKPWSLDVLFNVVQETLELAKVRSVDLGDLPRLGRIFPAIQSSTQMDTLLTKAGLTS